MSDAPVPADTPVLSTEQPPTLESAEQFLRAWLANGGDSQHYSNHRLAVSLFLSEVAKLRAALTASEAENAAIREEVEADRFDRAAEQMYVMGLQTQLAAAESRVREIERLLALNHLFDPTPDDGKLPWWRRAAGTSRPLTFIEAIDASLARSVAGPGTGKYGHAGRTEKYWQPGLGPCRCDDCEKLPMNAGLGTPTEPTDG